MSISNCLLQECSPEAKYSVSLLIHFFFSNKETSIVEGEAYWQLGLCNTQYRETANISQVEWRHFHHKSLSEILMTPSSMLKWPAKCSKPHFLNIYTSFFFFSIHCTNQDSNRETRTYFKNSSSF